ncbi:hypothetical protein [Planctellipticum variicoloris]|uniref:hypothetical protein n=1 Tax=Planctellipticum variicoloris TaxID=3064265 RepID=UPI0030133216|nr:hypothetical protein SH412_003459 [Planctomycetaceae bacterium SH412]
MYSSMKQLTQFMSRLQFDNFRGYLSHMDERFARDQMEYAAKFEEAAKHLSEAERSQLGEWYDEGFLYVSEVFPSLFGQNALTMVWSHFEHEMVEACRTDIIHETESLEVGEKNADKCNTLELVHKHLKDRGVQLLPIWSELHENIREVRNQIVHDNGRRYVAGLDGGPDDMTGIKTAKRSKQVDEYVASRIAAGKSGLSFDGDQLVVTTTFCREIAEMCEVLVAHVIEKMPDTEESYSRIEAIMSRAKKRRAKNDAAGQA